MSFFAYYMGPGSQVSFFAYYMGSPPSQVSFFAYYMGPPSSQFLRLLYGGRPQVSFFAYCMGAALRSVSSLTVWGPPSGQFLRLLCGAPLDKLLRILYGGLLRYILAGVTMTLFCTHGRVSGPNSLLDHEVIAPCGYSVPRQF